MRVFSEAEADKIEQLHGGTAYLGGYKEFDRSLLLRVHDTEADEDRYISFLGCSYVQGAVIWKPFAPTTTEGTDSIEVNDPSGNFRVVCRHCVVMDAGVEPND